MCSEYYEIVVVGGGSNGSSNSINRSNSSSRPISKGIIYNNYNVCTRPPPFYDSRISMQYYGHLC